MVSNKKYRYILEKKNEFERIATDAVAQNDRLLKNWENVLKEMQDIRSSNHNIISLNEELVAECCKLREQLAAVTSERDYYYNCLFNINEEV